MSTAKDLIFVLPVDNLFLQSHERNSCLPMAQIFDFKMVLDFTPFKPGFGKPEVLLKNLAGKFLNLPFWLFF